MDGTKKITTTHWVLVFSCAMGLLEAAVVVYLRALYYPDGFDFPLKPIPIIIAQVEIWREMATLLMLLGLGAIAGKNITTRWAYFLIAFAVWDLTYYAFLKIFLGWPASWYTWDVLFLLPMTWVGPVLAPMLVACTMIIFGGCILEAHKRHGQAPVGRQIWVVLSTGVVVILVTFTWDYGAFVLQDGRFQDLWSFSLDQELFAHVAHYVPAQFPWLLFFLGEALLLGGVLLYAKKYLTPNYLTHKLS